MLERIGDVALGVLGRLAGPLFSFGTLLSLSSLACAVSIAAAALLLRHYRRRRRTLRSRALIRALLPARVVRHASSAADAGYLLFSVYVYAVLIGLAGISYQFLTNALRDGLIALAGPVAPSHLPEFAQRAIVTSVLFLAYELGYWIDHCLKHRIPALWEMHKVHHSAEVLTPLTAFRMHPLDTFIFGQILAVSIAVANGAMAYSFGDTTYQYSVSGTNLILVVFIHLYVHLQHSHVWIAFRGALGRILLSPAHHQIHHSTNPAHFNRNFGSCLAVWDWLFGTLHMPAKERERLTFGVDDHPAAHTVTGEFILPFGRAFAAMFGWLRRKPVQAVEVIHQ